MKPDLSKIREELSKQLPTLSRRYQVKSLSIFGSYARQDQSDGSDIDVLVEYLEIPGLIRYIELENYLSDLLKIKVDLVLKDSLKPGIAKHVLAQAIQI